MGSYKEMDINVKLQKFQQICDTAIMTLATNLTKEILLSSIRLRQYHLFCKDMSATHGKYK
jgi:hypothetical protein